MTVTKSFSVEFDDALLDLDGWKNPRYDGSKLTGQKINEYNNGDVTYGKNPVITNKTVALYIGNTLIGGEDEDEQYAYIKKHSYININRILIINPETDKLTLLDATQEGFDSFHRFVTNDLPTGGSFNIRLLDYSIPNALSANTQNYVKMNKGWLLKSFSSGEYQAGYQSNNPLRLFKDLNIDIGSDITQSFVNDLVFQYANKPDNTVAPTFGPLYISSSIYSNKFTDEYYSGSYSFPPVSDNIHSANLSASKFIGYDSIKYLTENPTNTELHLTLFEGTKDFAPGFNDERSISTFEVDVNQNLQDTGTTVMGGAPRFQFFQLKGQSGSRFFPTITSTEINPVTSSYITFATSFDSFVAVGISCSVFVEGGDIIPDSNVNSQPYSGSFTYELSFLDKSHTLIADINKESSLPNGIGEKGFVIIPQQLDKRVKLNIDYYLSKAGLIDETFTKIT
jgi:hypothetical protein